MFRYAFLAASSAVADEPKAAGFPDAAVAAAGAVNAAAASAAVTAGGARS